MPSLFARISTGGNWDTITDETPEDSTFPADVLADILKGGNEVSVWEVAHAPSQKELDAQDLGPALDRLAAALHSEHAGDLSEVTFRIISDWKIKQLHLPMAKEHGASVDADLNRTEKHWTIQINTVGDAIKLAKAFKKRPPHFYSKGQVMRLFAVSVQQGRISTSRIIPGLWNKLLEGGYLQVIAQQHEPVNEA
jgi:hypothetical protein